MRRLILGMAALFGALYVAHSLDIRDLFAPTDKAATALEPAPVAPKITARLSGTASKPSAKAETRTSGVTAETSNASGGDLAWASLSRAGELRDGPSSHAKVLQDLSQGTAVEIVWRRRDGWVQIKSPANLQIGWTRETNLSFGPSSAGVRQASSPAPASSASRTEIKSAEVDQRPAPAVRVKRHHRYAGRRRAYPPSDYAWSGRSYGYYRSYQAFAPPQ